MTRPSLQRAALVAMCAFGLGLAGCPRPRVGSESGQASSSRTSCPSFDAELRAFEQAFALTQGPWCAPPEHLERLVPPLRANRNWTCCAAKGGDVVCGGFVLGLPPGETYRQGPCSPAHEDLIDYSTGNIRRFVRYYDSDLRQYKRQQHNLGWERISSVPSGFQPGRPFVWSHSDYLITKTWTVRGADDDHVGEEVWQGEEARVVTADGRLLYSDYGELRNPNSEHPQIVCGRWDVFERGIGDSLCKELFGK